ncbi:MAG: tetratricopeptide repeat protein [Bacteroidales bacterium]
MKAKFTFFLVTSLMLTGLWGCFSPKEATANIPGLEVDNSLYEPEESEAMDADMSGYLQDTQSRFGEDSVTCVKNWSLYDEYYRQKNYKMAVEPWRWMFNNCPRASQNIYIHGANLVKFLYSNETDPTKQEALVDTLMMVYDQRIKYFNAEGRVLGRKAADLYQLRPDAVQEQFDVTERAIELEGQNAQGDVLFINFQSTARLVEAGVLDATVIIEHFDRASDIIDYNLENNPEDSTYYMSARSNIDMLFEPYASCENLVKIYRPRYDKNPEDVELLEKITDMLNKSQCTDDELFYLASQSLHRIQPTAQSAFLMGRMESASDNYNEAMKYFEQAIELYEDEEEKFNTYLLMASIMHQQMNNKPQARVYARRAIDIRPDDGRPYLMIGEMYAASARDCGDNDLTKKVAYWAAVDKFIQARNVDSDPDIKDKASQLINTYSQYFPDVETIFFYGLSEGESYRVECWINETTRVRPR